MDHWIDTGDFLTVDKLTDIGMTSYLCHCPGRIVNVSSTFDLDDKKLTF